MAESEVAFAIQELHLKPKDRILDLCSGPGRHLIQLQRRGFNNAVGIDLSPTLLRAAKENLEDPRVLVRGDMRQLPFSTRFDAVLCLFTSFGYFSRDDENLQALREIHRVLRPNGCVLLDLLSHTVAERLVPKSERTVDGAHVIETRRYDAKTRRIEKEISISGPEGDHRYRESVRVYNFKEISHLFADSGLSLAAVYGDFQGGHYHASSERMIVVGVRLEVPANLTRNPFSPSGIP
jgi:ubiquinone/menaquinone biosynthesis C-methylase UbiE